LAGAAGFEAGFLAFSFAATDFLALILETGSCQILKSCSSLEFVGVSGVLRMFGTGTSLVDGEFPSPYLVCSSGSYVPPYTFDF